MPDFSGWNWVAETLPRRKATFSSAAVVDRRRSCPLDRRARRAANGRNTSTAAAPRPANNGSSLSSRCSWFHCICGRLTPGGNPTNHSRHDPKAGSLASSSLPSKSICMPTQMPRNGRAGRRRLRGRRPPGRRHARQPCMPRRRQHQGAPPRQRQRMMRWIAGQCGDRPDMFEGLLGRAQVADAVVEHSNPAAR